MKYTIDLTKIDEKESNDPFCILTPKYQVEAAMSLSGEVNHIEAKTKSTYTVEMKSGDWLTIPKEALRK